MGQASNFCQIISNCALTLPTNPKDSITEDVVALIADLNNDQKNDVIVGAGARILGNITIGEHAVISANSVILKDVVARSERDASELFMI